MTDNKETKTRELNEEELKQIDGAGDDKEYKCSVCQAVFASRKALYAHKQASGHI